MKSLFRNLTARALTSPLQLVFLMTTTWLGTSKVGASSYSVAILLAGVPLLFPFLDLGSSSALITGFSQKPSKEMRLDLFAFAIKRATISAGTVLAAGVFLANSPASLSIFGPSTKFFENPGLLFFIFSVIFSSLVMLGPAAKILVGLGLNHVTMYFGLATSALTLMLTACLSTTDAPVDFYALAPLGSAFLVGVLLFRKTLLLTSITFIELFKASYLDKRKLDTNVSRGSNYMLLITLSLAVIQFSDRFVVSIFGPLGDVPSFVYLSQVYVPVWAAISSVLIAIWPHLSAIRSEHGYQIAKKEFLKVWGKLSIIGAIAGAVFACGTPSIIRQISSGEVQIDYAISSAFGFLLFLQIVHFPVGVFLTDSPGLRFQSIWVSIGAVTYLPLAIYLTLYLGVVGPTLAGIFLIIFFQLLPNSIFYSRGADRV